MLTRQTSFCRKIIEFFNGTFFLHFLVKRKLNEILDTTDRLVKRIDKERFKPVIKPFTPPPPYTNPDTMRSDLTTRSIDGYLCPPFLMPTPAALEMPASISNSPIPISQEIEPEPQDSEPVTMIHKAGITVNIQHQQQQKFISAKSILRSPIMDPHQG